jgi:hypothetical protein
VSIEELGFAGNWGKASKPKRARQRARLLNEAAGAPTSIVIGGTP